MEGLKLVKANATTAQVVAALNKHPTWKAKAPETVTLHAVSVSVVGAYATFHTRSMSGPPGKDVPLKRSDWRIYRPKRKAVKLGVFTKLGANIPPLNCEKLDDGKRSPGKPWLREEGITWESKSIQECARRRATRL